MVEFPLHTNDSAPKAAQRILQEAERRFGFVPNLYRTLAEAPAALTAYHEVGLAFASSSLSPAEQQVVLLTVSQAHECQYCVAAHSMVGSTVGLSDDDVTALRGDRNPTDEKLKALRSFTRAVVEKRGWVDDEDLAAFLDAGYERPQVLEVLAGVTQKTLSNYTNHITRTPLDEAMRPFAWEPVSAG